MVNTTGIAIVDGLIHELTTASCLFPDAYIPRLLLRYKVKRIFDALDEKTVGELCHPGAPRLHVLSQSRHYCIFETVASLIV